MPPIKTADKGPQVSSSQIAMTLPKSENPLSLRFASTSTEIRAVQALRYQIFYGEFGATPNEITVREKRDFDEYDEVADHLMVIDSSLPAGGGQIVGTYRLIRHDRLKPDMPFYSANEFDLDQILKSKNTLLELGRSCVLPAYRTKATMQLLWQGIADYLVLHQIDLMFGCSCLHGTSPETLAPQLAYLYHYHLAPPDMMPIALGETRVDMNLLPQDRLDAKRIFASLPPLFKGYLRLGAMVGNGAYIDYQFNSTDVCIVLPTRNLTSKYVRHYEREIQKSIIRPVQSEDRTQV
jgi:putative hemolysin